MPGPNWFDAQAGRDVMHTPPENRIKRPTPQPKPSEQVWQLSQGPDAQNTTIIPGALKLDPPPAEVRFFEPYEVDAALLDVMQFEPVIEVAASHEEGDIRVIDRVRIFGLNIVPKGTPTKKVGE